LCFCWYFLVGFGDVNFRKKGGHWDWDYWILELVLWEEMVIFLDQFLLALWFLVLQHIQLILHQILILRFVLFLFSWNKNMCVLCLIWHFDHFVCLIQNYQLSLCTANVLKIGPNQTIYVQFVELRTNQFNCWFDSDSVSVLLNWIELSVVRSIFNCLCYLLFIYFFIRLNCDWIDWTIIYKSYGRLHLQFRF
jgi:hypothetical protein